MKPSNSLEKKNPSDTYWRVAKMLCCFGLVLEMKADKE